MAHLRYLVQGGKAALQRFVTTPFFDNKQLKSEIIEHWQLDPVYCGKKFEILGPEDDFGDEIHSASFSVLYIVAHSGRAATHIGDSDGNKKTAEQLVGWLVDRNLPKDLLCLKIWACYSGSNGFAREVKTRLNQHGYKTIVVGYTEATGGPNDMGTSKLEEQRAHKHVWEEENGQRGNMLSRGKYAQAIFDT